MTLNMEPHISAIVCEYNPFHNGHAYHIRQTRQNGATHIVAVMSGNFIQRGSCALLSKWARAEMALRGGADLVIELPLPWAMATAQRFASGAVFLIHSMGCVSSLSFGSECEHPEQLKHIASSMDSAPVRELLRHALDQGLSFAAAQDRAVSLSLGEQAAHTLRSPNNLLGIEYLRALDRLKSDIAPIVIARKGAEHDGNTAVGTFASASFLRNLLSAGDQKNAEPFWPASSQQVYARELAAGRAPAQLSRMERAILAKLRMMSPEEFARLPDVCEGLEYRIASAVKTACSLEEVFSTIKTKRYTHARIRRIILSAYLGIEPAQLPPFPPAIRVLGFNSRGTEILKRMKTSATLPVVQRARDVASLPPQARALFRLEERASDLFALALPSVQPCGMEQTTGVIRL